MSHYSIFEDFDGSIEDLFLLGEKYTFLAGAGISMDAPTNMPSARDIVRDLLTYCAPPEEVNNLLGLDGLRYELVVEKIQDIHDEDLKFMDYLEIVDLPNLIHFFLAHLIKMGHHVITTNFDYLIENALIDILPENLHFNIYPIITKEDFLSFQDPDILLNAGKYPIFKIHGSKRNFITGQDTQDSLITTISALGREREEGTTFAIEPYKKPAIYNLMKNRTLIVMGYSGSDDFDIGPMLKELPFLSRLIWVEHTSSDQITIRKVKPKGPIENQNQISKLHEALAEIRSQGDIEVFLINVHTNIFIRDHLWSLLLPNTLFDESKILKSDGEIPDFGQWIQPFYSNISLIEKYRFATDLFYNLKDVNAATRCTDKGLALAKQEG
ncbi:MAG: hypothetical protein EU539_08930, partial [Promethearchaeota archaeon]